ncbi:hypothetical protein [Lignipirellula cremea]|uniref:Uncharacterized protein n=1 Tax=Lignipirellula cremea TaxID=2528010 RepID=A0A518DKP5_9BACT|nr:hypothetical protein [Lignipirellula cremea]QDU92407.1 hypothetical protein Pla8534_01550 [Lignipirellula cremea]
MANVGYHISDTTVGNVLKQHGIEPAPDRQRQTTWVTFLKAHWDVLAAIDFTTVEVWTKDGLVTYYLLFVMELKTRRVHFAGCTPHRRALKAKKRIFTSLWGAAHVTAVLRTLPARKWCERQNYR